MRYIALNLKEWICNQGIKISTIREPIHRNSINGIELKFKLKFTVNFWKLIEIDYFRIDFNSYRLTPND